MNLSSKHTLPIKWWILVFFLIGFYFTFTTLLICMLPFILGWILSILLEPGVCILTKYFRLSRSTAAFLMTSLFILFLSSILGLIGGKIIMELSELSLKLSYHPRQFFIDPDFIAQKLQLLYTKLPSSLAHFISQSTHNILQSTHTFLLKAISYILNIISAIPKFVIFILVTILSTFFISKDKPTIKAFIKAQCPPTIIPTGILVKKDLFSALIGYIKAQFILMILTFIQSAIGLTVLGLNYSILIAFLISFLDALPMVGAGCIYIPLILFYLSKGCLSTVLGLSILYVLILLIRQCMEPRILGKQIGLHPLVTLMSIYMGLKIFGILGILIGPIAVILFSTLQKAGILPLWKR